MGFSKRSFAEWRSQVEASFKESEGAANKFKNVLKTMFTSPSVKEDKWIRNKAGEIVSKDNINSYIPELDTAEARTQLEKLQEKQTEINKAKASWDDYSDNFKYGKKYLQDYAKGHDVLKASVDDLKKANKDARTEVIDHNKALEEQTFKFKASAAGIKLLKTALNTIAYATIATAISAAINAIISKVSEIVNAYENGINKINDLTGEVKNLESEQESLNEQLKESKERLYELQQIKMPNLFEESAIENLKEYNKQLEAEIRLKELELELKKKEANETAQETFRKSQYDNNPFDDARTENYDWWEEIINFLLGNSYASIKNSLENITNIFQGNTWEQQEDYLNQAEKALEDFEDREATAQRYKEILDEMGKYREIVNSGRKATLEDIKEIFGEDVLERFDLPFENFIERIDHMLTDESAGKFLAGFDEAAEKSQGTLDEYISNLTERLRDARIELGGYDVNDPNNAKRIEELNDWIERAEKVVNYQNQIKDFIGVYNDVDYSDVVVQLEALAKEGKLQNALIYSVV